MVNPLGLDVKKLRLSWKIIALKDDGVTAEENIPRDVIQSAYRITVASSQANLAEGKFDMWDSGFINSDQSTQIMYSGQPLASHSFYFWKVQIKVTTSSSSAFFSDSASISTANAPKFTVKDSVINFWQIGFLDEKEIVGKWIGTVESERKWIEVLDVSKEKETYCKIKKSVPSPYLRKSIVIKKGVKKAVVYASAMGDYELFINGNRLSNQQLAPEWTVYSKRVQYQAHDITDTLKQGSNIIGSILGDGWCLGNLGPGDKIWQLHYSTQRYFFLQLRIVYEDGSIETISSDGSWKYWADGPIQAADNFLGCEYDCSKEIKGWNTVGYNDTNWESVLVNESIKPHLVAQKNEPVEIFHEFSPVSITECKPNMYIVNFGQNLVGWCRLSVKGNHTSQVTIRHGEMLDDDGTLYTHNLRLAPQIDTYKITDNDEHTLEPHFTFHGFQYIEITGLTKKPAAEDILACAISSTSPLVGSFECSDPMLNKLWSNILWTQRDNMVSIPTDCPQRNERMGWMGDCLAFAQTGIYNTDLAAFFSKFCQDIRDEQTADGRYTDFIPHPQDESRYTDSPGWADNGIELPWRLYINYGDLRILEEEIQRQDFHRFHDHPKAHAGTLKVRQE